MAKDSFTELLAFVAVAREQSFTRASAVLGVSQSALSHSIRQYESKLGVRLLARTTRSVSPTEAGERLLLTVLPQLEAIDSELAQMRAQQNDLASGLRIITTEQAYRTLLWPSLVRLLHKQPEMNINVQVEASVSAQQVKPFDLVFSADEHVFKGYQTERVGHYQLTVIVVAPTYLEQAPVITRPEQLSEHRCIQLRHPALMESSVWVLEKDGQTVRVPVASSFTTNTMASALDAALAGVGLARVPMSTVNTDIEKGCLREVLAGWVSPSEVIYLSWRTALEGTPALECLLASLTSAGRFVR